MTFRRDVLRIMALGGMLAIMAATPALADNGVVRAEGRLRDLQPTTANATDGASARLVAYPDGRGGTAAILIVTGINDSVGTVYGAHAHTGPCVAGDGAAAGPHFNTTAAPPAAPTTISSQTELWLDFRVRNGGVGIGQASVPFVIPPGAARSVVIHLAATNPTTGVAGARQACLPVAF